MAVETTLAVAITFLMHLEKREAANFGMKTDPVKSTRDMSRERVDAVAYGAKELGWDAKAMDPLRGRSSTWIDTIIHGRWSGRGFKQSERILFV